MHQDFYLGLLPIVMGILTVVLFNYIDQSKFQVRGVVGPYFAALALLFGLFTSLTASDIWQRAGKANTLVCTEANSLASLLEISKIMAPAEAVIIKSVVRDYTRETQTIEFSDTKQALSTNAVEALHRLYAIAASPVNFNHVVPIQTEFLKSLEQARGAHLERIELKKRHLVPTKLLIIFIFGLLTQFSIALCHAGNTRASWASVMLFSLAFSAAVSVLTKFADPIGFSSMISATAIADI